MTPIQFSHANGFPSTAYKTFFQQFDGIEFNAVERFGHTAFTIQKDWSPLVDELIASIEAQYDQPIIGLGHSLGGVLTLFAAQRRPELFRHIILLDPPIFNPRARAGFTLAKKVGKISSLVPPARLAKTRKESFESRQEAYDYWARKRFFKSFDPRCFEDYVTYGLRETSGGVSLYFDKEIEYNIFCTLPTRIKSLEVDMPIHFMYSNLHQVLRAKDLRWLKRKMPNANFIPVDAGHMFPLEQPKETALKIQEILDQFHPQKASV